MAFKTIPEDDTGCPHILEHSVLNGSKNFPGKSTFMELIKGSMHTFINAMTASDMTMYPVGSTNDKDFLNLTRVYLDADKSRR
jgi:Zn-dependent M16 (insulinase) family peptidase